MNDHIVASPGASQSHVNELNFDPTGKTVEQVKEEIIRFLLTAELKVSGIEVANWPGQAQIERFGLLPHEPWPDTTSDDRNLVVWVGKGKVSGWLVRVELHAWTKLSDGNGRWCVEPLLVASTQVREDAWDIAALISWILGVD